MGEVKIKRPPNPGRPVKLLYNHIHNAANLPHQAECFFVRFVCFLFFIMNCKDKFAFLSSQILLEFNQATKRLLNAYLSVIC